VRELEQQRRRDERDRALDDQRVMTFGEWCAVNNISYDTGRRLRKAGKGPVFTQTSDRRIGVTVANNRKWQAARERA
jgi:predicted site-specific integrase-resolvase